MNGTRTTVGLRGTGLSLGYHGTTVVDSASLAIGAGEVTALIGPNGSGKSTLLRSLARLHRPESGSIHVGDTTAAEALSARQFAKVVTLLTQSRPTPAGISVQDVVGFGRHPHQGRWRSQDEHGPRAVAWALEVTGVVDMAHRCVDELSGGELQRVWLATCLAQDTEVLLLDEPTNHLDLRYQMEILDLIRDLADEHGIAVGVVLHDLNHAAVVADHMVLLRRGRVTASGTVPEVLTSAHLSEAYDVPIDVRPDPLTGVLTAQPVSRRRAALLQPA